MIRKIFGLCALLMMMASSVGAERLRMPLVDVPDTIVLVRIEAGDLIDSTTVAGAAAQAAMGIDTVVSITPGLYTQFVARVVFLSDLTASSGRDWDFGTSFEQFIPLMNDDPLNLVRNSGFERDSATAGTAPDFWILGAGTHTVSESKTSTSGGRWAFQMEAGVLDDTMFVYQQIGELPSGIYYMSVTADNTITAPTVETAYLVIDDAVPTTTSSHIDSLAIQIGLGVEQEAGKIVALPTGTIFIGLQTNNGGLANDTTRVLFDNIKLVPLALDSVTIDNASAGSVWDILITGALHSLPTSAGRRLRELSDQGIIHSGTSDNVPANTASTISLETGGGTPTVSSLEGFYTTARVTIIGGTGAGQPSKVIPHYSGSNQVATISPGWSVTPDATSEYIISSAISYAGVVAGGYEGGAVWISPNGVNSALVGVAGTQTNPIDDSNLDSARAVADSLMLQVYHLIPGASITLDEAYDNWEFIGTGYVVALGGQSVSGSRFIQGFISGVGTGANRVVFRDCIVGDLELPVFSLLATAVNGTITKTGTGTSRFLHSESGDVNGIARVSFSSALNQNIVIQGWDGNLVVDSMGEGGTDSLGMNTNAGSITINSSNISGVVTLRGVMSWFNNGTLTLLDTIAAINNGSIADAVLEEDTTGHYTSPNFAFAASQVGGGGAADSLAIARHVWRSTSGDDSSYGAGTMGANSENWDATGAGGSGLTTIVIGATDTAGADIGTLISGVPVTLLDAGGSQIGGVQFTDENGYTTWGLTTTDVITVLTGSNIYNGHLMSPVPRTFIVGSIGDTVAWGHATTPGDSVLPGDDFTVAAPAAPELVRVWGHIRNLDNTGVKGATVTASLTIANTRDSSRNIVLPPLVEEYGPTDSSGYFQLDIPRSKLLDPTQPYSFNAWSGRGRTRAVHINDIRVQTPDSAIWKLVW